MNCSVTYSVNSIIPIRLLLFDDPVIPHCWGVGVMRKPIEIQVMDAAPDTAVLRELALLHDPDLRSADVVRKVSIGRIRSR